MDLCNYYENLLSSTVEGSDIWRINHSPLEYVEVSEETAELINTAIEYCDLSDGRIDITLGKISALWNFSEESASDNPSVPSEDEINRYLSHVNYENVILEPHNDSNVPMVMLTDSEAQIELGFIAKGFIADRLYDYLKDSGVNSAIINLGGNVKCLGSKPDEHSVDGIDFKIGIQKPFDNLGTPITYVNISDSSVVSSGVYERYYKIDDRLYHHILDPDTGYPVENNLLSVSIITKSSTNADALSTLCLILGLEDGMALIEGLNDTEAIFITDDYELHMTSGL